MSKIVAFYEQWKFLILRISLALALVTGFVFAIFPELTLIYPIFIISLTSFALAITELLVDIHANVSSRRPHMPTLFNDLNATFQEIRRRIEKDGQKRKPSDLQQLDILAFTLSHVWPQLEAWFLSLSDKQFRLNCAVTLYHMDAQHAKAFGLKGHSDRIKQSLVAIDRFFKDHRQLLDTLGVTVKTVRYTYMSSMHGFLLNGNELYYSFFSWAQHDLQGVQNPYVHVARAGAKIPNSGVEDYYIRIFSNWLSNARAGSVVTGKESNNTGNSS